MAENRGVRSLCLAVVVGLLAVAPARAGTGGAGLGTPTSTPPAHHPAHHPAPAPRRPAHHPRPGALHSRAMWIWELGDSADGDLSAIIDAAHANRVTTLIVKSSDGVHLWSQFTPALVHRLHAAHLRVCAWQYVYGARPGVEANLGADAVSDGADCLVIDAETQYQGRYVAAQAYVNDLRKQIGERYPLALASFPYVDYHPGFPYSVFLGPGGAQTDVPQMYWRDIGSSVASVFAHTYAFNLPYGRPIDPLGQLYGNPPMRQIVRFRTLARAYGAGGVSWWDWQSARARGWDALSLSTGPEPQSLPVAQTAPVGRGAIGDLVVWIQEHLVSAGLPSAIDGAFGRRTRAAVVAFQTAKGLSPDGIVGPETWSALLRYRPAAVHWVRRNRHTFAGSDALSDGGAALTLPVPASASRPARRDEIPSSLGAGAP